MTGRVLITCKQMQEDLETHRSRLEAAGLAVDAPVLRGQQFSAAELGPMMPGVVAMIAGDDQLDASFFDASPDLEVLVRWGIGMDSVDHDAARDHQVVVRNTPGVFGAEVADSALGYVLMLARGHHAIDRAVRSGRWPKREGVTLAGETLGVVALGDIGREVAARARGFGMHVIAHDPFVTEADGVTMVTMPELLAQARFVVLCCPLTPETHHLVDSDALGLMRPDAYLVNVARGPVVDEAALVAALTTGRLAGAGLDVFEVEPLPDGSPLRSLDQVVLGAHNGSNTRQGVARASERAVSVLLEELGRA